MLKRLVFALASLCLAGGAFAQVSPYVYGALIGTTPVQVLSNNALRRKIFLYNPNLTAIIAFCPVGPNRATGAVVTCAVNGAGSITLDPRAGLMLDGAVAQGPPLSIPSAWNAVANGASSAYTVIEFE